MILLGLDIDNAGIALYRCQIVTSRLLSELH